MFLGKLSAAVKRAFTRFVRFGGKLGWWKVIAGAVALVLLVALTLHFTAPKTEVPVQSDQARQVTVRSVAELSANTVPLSVAGTVSSKSEASVRAEAGGQITALNYAIGDYVSAGSIIAQVENSSQRAAIAQAQASLQAAEAGASVSQTSLSAAKQTVVTSLLSAYSSVDKAVRADNDPIFSNPSSANPQLTVPTSNTQAQTTAQNLRATLNGVLARDASRSTSISVNDDLSSEIILEEADLKQVRDFLDALLTALNSGVATNGVTQAQITADIATANGSRSAITASLSALVSAEQGLESAQKATGTGQDVSSSGAAIAQAQAGLDAARASYEKTVIRAPISGTINTLPLKLGDYLAAGSLAVTVANNGALEVVAYVTSDDAQEIAVGNAAAIEGTNPAVTGVITRIAPAIDTTTGKIEVHVGITNNSSELVNGQAVTADLTRIAHSSSGSGAQMRTTIPITALKIGAEDMSVYTVSTSSTLVAHTVTIGQLLGDRVVIESGLTDDMEIVTDARGLQPGQLVSLK